jgi:hypothetical protein
VAKHRFINTKFWNDSYISELNPLQKLLFVYFLTNEHTNIAGVYELPLKIMAVETGLPIGQLSKILPRLKGKINYIDGWVCIKNFQKHQSARGDSKVIKGIENALKDVPEHIKEKMASLSKESIPLVSDEKPLASTSNNMDLDMDIDLDMDSDVREKPRTSKNKFEQVDLDSANLLLRLIQKNNPNYKPPANLESWANEFRLMREQDNRTTEQIDYVIKWSQQDNFWKANILSAGAVRRQFDKLVAKIQQEKQAPNKGIKILQV